MLLKLKSYRSRGCVICANINTFRNRIIQIINYMPFLLDCMIARHKYPSFSLFHKKSCNEIAGRTKFFAPPSLPLSKVFNLRYLMPETFSVESLASFVIYQKKNTSESISGLRSIQRKHLLFSKCFHFETISLRIKWLC